MVMEEVVSVATVATLLFQSQTALQVSSTVFVPVMVGVMTQPSDAPVRRVTPREIAHCAHARRACHGLTTQVLTTWHIKTKLCVPMQVAVRVH